MKSILSERNIAMALFVMVLVTFALAQEDSKKMEQMYSGSSSTVTSRPIIVQQPADETKNKKVGSLLLPIFSAE